MPLSKDNAIFALLILNDIEAGGDAEHLDVMLRQLLASSGYAVGKSKEHHTVAVNVQSGVAISAFDSPLVTRPDNVTPMRPRREAVESTPEGEGV